jgi:hypothetical protein
MHTSQAKMWIIICPRIRLIYRLSETGKLFAWSTQQDYHRNNKE